MTRSEFRRRASALKTTQTEQHSRLCADYIGRYWRKRGYEINAHIKAVDDPRRACHNLHVVVSNLVNGLPTHWRGESIAERDRD